MKHGTSPRTGSSPVRIKRKAPDWSIRLERPRQRREYDKKTPRSIRGGMKHGTSPRDGLERPRQRREYDKKIPGLEHPGRGDW